MVEGEENGQVVLDPSCSRTTFVNKRCSGSRFQILKLNPEQLLLAEQWIQNNNSSYQDLSLDWVVVEDKSRLANHRKAPDKNNERL